MTDARIPFKKGLDPISQKMKHVPRFLFDLADETPNRDELRTPMQWSSLKSAGFSAVDKIGLPVHTNFHEVNVEIEKSDDSSLLRTIQEILKSGRIWQL
jgi:glycosidase